MKTTIIILIAICLISLSSCEQKTDTNVMLENSETRTELYDAISNNHDYMTEFMDKMQSSNQGMQMMQGNKKMMGTMMKDGRMMGRMMKMMHQEGMMSDNCMQSSMKMMGEKGMNMDGMGMVNDNK